MIRHLSRLLLQTMRPERMAAYRRLARDQWLPADGLRERSLAGVTAVLRHACARVPFYRDFCREAGLDPAAVDHKDLPTFPRLGKAELGDRPARFLDPEAPAAAHAVGFTGGSSGSPFRFVNDRRLAERRHGNDMRARAWTGWRPGDKQAVLWAHPRDNAATGSWRGRLLAGLVHRSRTLDAYDMDDAALAAFHRALTEYRPVLLLGFASSLAFLADYFRDRGLPAPPLRAIIASAETLTPAHRRAVEACFPCPLHNRYGSREFGVVAQQCEALDGLHVFNDQVHVEVLDPAGRPVAAGERGEIVITDLGNRVMPFVRYRTGDLARRTDAACACGRGLPLLASVEGRTSELLVGRDGSYYSCLGPFFFGSDITGVAQMQVVQESRERVVLRVVRGADWREETAALLAARLRAKLGDVVVDLEFPDTIPPSASGKHRFAISKVTPFAG